MNKVNFFLSAFDAQDRLTSWQRFNSNGNEIDNRSWDLSLIGNQDVVTINGQTDNRTYNDTHQLLSKINRTYQYGIRGYQTKRSTSSSFSSSQVSQKLSWDIDGHLKQINNASNNRLIAKYAYDALGRRIRKQIFSNSKIAETRIYVNSGNRVADEYQARRGNRFSILRRYVYGNYIDDVVGIIYGSSSFYYHHQDRQYSSRALTNGRGGIVESYSYTPYGERITDSSFQANRLKQSQYGQSIGFTGRYFDSETGLYYFRARYYDTEQGRFISRDPAGYVDGMGLYNGYFAMSFAVDPSGREALGGQYSAGAYLGVGGSAKVVWKTTRKDCCDENDKKIKNGEMKMEIEASGHVGFGFGGHVDVPIFGRKSLQYKIAGIDVGGKAFIESPKCGELPKEGCVETFATIGIDNEFSFGAILSVEGKSYGKGKAVIRTCFTSFNPAHGTIKIFATYNITIGGNIAYNSNILLGGNLVNQTGKNEELYSTTF